MRSLLQRFKQLSLIKKLLVLGVGGGILGFLALQVFPAGLVIESFKRPERNPPIISSIEWNSPEAEAIARKACYDCHSHETEWPWYSYIAPVSWIINRDVNHGRESMNFSDYDAGALHAEDVRDHVYYDMPPEIYLPMHPDAKLTDEEREILIAAIVATLPENTSGNGTDMQHE